MFPSRMSIPSRSSKEGITQRVNYQHKATEASWESTSYGRRIISERKAGRITDWQATVLWSVCKECEASQDGDFTQLLVSLLTN
jgi:hypothetical protein